MGESCSIPIHIRNSKGEVVESKLFNSLTHYLSDRGLAKQYYGVGTNTEFLNEVRSRAKFDENGEITFNSLRNLAKINIGQEKLLATLNKDIKSGIYSYEDAITKLQNFNRDSQFAEEFMATISPINEKYKLSVIPRTKVDEATLEKVIADRTLYDRILYHLNKAGVSVEFIEGDNKSNGRYSTVNAKKTAEGLYNLIKVTKGEKLTEALAEEAGHFAVGALGKSPLVERLTKLLTPEVQKRILGDEYESKSLGKSASREVAGSLVGKAIMNNIDKESPWNKLAYRIVDMAKRIFATIKGDQVMKDILDADKIARGIARNFMSSEQEGSIENALSIRETLYSARNSYNIRKFREVVNNLNKTAYQLRAISDDLLAEKMSSIYNVTVAGRLGSINANPNSVFSDGLALDGIAEALSLILDKIGPGKEINNILDSVDFLNTADFKLNMASNGRKLRQVHTFVTNSFTIQRSIFEAINVLPDKESLVGDITNIQFTDSLGTVVSVDLAQIIRDLTEANEAILSELMLKEKQFFLKFCEDSLGSTYVYRASRVIWNIGKNKKKNSEGRTPLVRLEKGKRVDISSVLENLESDINLFERFLGSMSNNPDIIGQIVDKVTKMANKYADDITNACWDELRILEDRFRKFDGLNTRDLYERFDDGSLTGNIISKLHYGKWEKDWEEFKEAKKREFKDTTPNLDLLSEPEKALRWNQYFKPFARDWHLANSKWDSVLERYVPNSTIYSNDAYDRISRKYGRDFDNWYNDYMQLKESLDSRLPEGSTLGVRLPQFKGTYTNIVRNQTGNLIDSHKSALRSKLRDTFCESSEDTDFGSDQTYNSEDEEMFANALAYEKEQIHRLPIYGINKLKNMGELSTDIFHSTLAYASMANSYLAMNTIVDTIEVGSTVLKDQRKVEGIIEKGRKNPSRAYTRYLKFVDKQVYGISSSKHKIFGGIIIEKVAAALSNFASKYFLGGNVPGGAVNTMTGFNELFKEAIAAEYFSLKDFTNANKLYYKYFVQNWMEYGKEFKENKVSLFIRHFNVLGENRTKYRDWHTNNKIGRRLYNMLNESIFLPYKSGDHYMQSISYLALANKIKVYDESGTKVSLFNAYSITDNEDTNGNKKGKTLEMKGIFFKTKNGKAEYDIIQSIISKISSSSTGGPFGGVIRLTSDEQEYINKKGYNIADKEDTLKSLEDDASSLTWTKTDESAFMDKCREINNRLHGIYNNQDKVAFQQNMFGNMVLAMRGYALGMIERRYAPSHYSVALGQEVEGSLNTLGKVILSSDLSFGAKLAMTMLPFITSLNIPIGRKAKLAMYKAGFSSNQIANMRRNWGDALLILSLLLLKGLAGPGSNDDDYYEEDSIPAELVYYFASRLYREQAAFNTPTGLWHEQTTLTDLMPVGGAALKDLCTLGWELGGAIIYDEDNPDFYYQSSKEGKYEIGDAKVKAHIQRITPYWRSWYPITHGYEAAKSFEYGKNIKAR